MLLREVSPKLLSMAVSAYPAGSLYGRYITHLDDMPSDTVHVLARLDLAYYSCAVRLGPLGDNHGSSNKTLQRQ